MSTMSDYAAQPTPDPDHLVETTQTLRDDDTESPRDDRGSGAEDHPLGAEKFGTTHAEAEQGESLDQKLAEEEPEIGAHDPLDDIVADLERRQGEESDDDILGDAYRGTSGGTPFVGDDDEVGGEDVGRLVAPDEGAHGDDEKDEIASAVGRDSEELSAEEAAIHLEP